MYQSIEDRGRFTDAALDALFADSVEPTRGEIEEAMRDTQTYGEVAERLVSRRGLSPKTYIAEQEVFGPFVTMMALAGWTLAGSGYFSCAFYKGSLVLKISLKSKDDAARKYLDWAKDQGDLPGLPTIHAFLMNDYTHAVLMERCYSIVQELDSDSAWFEPSIAMEYEEIKEGVEQGKTGDFSSSSTAALIHEVFQGDQFDIHPGNVMICHGRLVIMDPLGMSSDDARPGGESKGYTCPVTF